MGFERWDINQISGWRRQSPEVLADLDRIVARMLPMAEQALAESREYVWTAVLPREPSVELEVSAWTASDGVASSVDVWRRLRDHRARLRAAALVGVPWRPQAPPAVSGILLQFEHRTGVAVDLVYPRQGSYDYPGVTDELARLLNPVALEGSCRVWTD